MIRFINSVIPLGMDSKHYPRGILKRLFVICISRFFSKSKLYTFLVIRLFEFMLCFLLGHSQIWWILNDEFSKNKEKTYYKSAISMTILRFNEMKIQNKHLHITSHTVNWCLCLEPRLKDSSVEYWMLYCFIIKQTFNWFLTSFSYQYFFWYVFMVFWGLHFSYITTWSKNL